MITASTLKTIWVVCFISLCGVFITTSSGLASDTASGMKLQVLLPENNSEFVLGEPIPINIDLQVNSKWPVHTLRSFEQVELTQSIIVTGPDGQQYRPDPLETAADMPPALSWNNRPAAPAITLTEDWTRSVAVYDLAVLVPVMGWQPGVYEIDVRQSFLRFSWLVELDNIGQVGLLDENRNWDGTIVAEQKLKINIVPQTGARINIGVFDISSGESKPILMRPVRVYRMSDLENEGETLDLSNVWSKAGPVLTGNTDVLEGRAVWQQGDLCLPEDDYVVIALYKDEFAAVYIKAGDQAAGWQPACEGQVTQHIYFGEEPEKYSLFGMESIYLGDGARVYGGHVGTLDNSGITEVVDVQEDVYAADNIIIVGDKVILDEDVSLYTVYYNTLTFDDDDDDDPDGAVIREPQLMCSPLDECNPPKWRPPEVQPVNLGADLNDLIVFYTGSMPAPIDQGDFDEVILAERGILKLNPGTYNFKRLKMGYASQIQCLGPVKINIKEKMYTDYNAYIGPDPRVYPPVDVSGGAGNAVYPKDIVIYVEGADVTPTSTISWEYSQAAYFNKYNHILANMYVPNGTLKFMGYDLLQGAFFARDLIVGYGSKVWLDSGF